MVIKAIDGLNEITGRIVSIFAVFFAAIIIYDVFMRYALNEPTRWAFDVSKQLFGFYFIMLGGYALRHNAHVRVDVLYRTMSPRAKARVDLLGTLFLLWPVCFLIFYVSFPYVEASWSVREGSRETSGIQGVYLLKSVILAFVVLLALQGLSTIIHALRILSGAELPPEEASPIL